VLNKLKSVIGIEKDIDYSLESILYQVNTTQQQQHQESLPRIKEIARDTEICQKLEQWTVFTEPDSSTLVVPSVEVELTIPKVFRIPIRSHVLQ
jgi:hypothetical protein